MGPIFKMLKAAMRYCKRTGRPANVYLTLGSDSKIELSTVVQNDMEGLHLDCGRGFVHCELDIPPCPTLRYLSITYLRNADNVLKAFISRCSDRSHAKTELFGYFWLFFPKYRGFSCPILIS